MVRGTSPVDSLVAFQENKTMEIYEIRNKLVDVWAAARLHAQHYRHTGKFAKYLVAFAIRQIKKFNDVRLVRFLTNDKIGKIFWLQENIA